jgi:hypothetical protein
MTVRITTEARPTWRDVQGRFARAERELLEARREEMRGQGRVIVQIARGKLREKVKRPSGLENAIRFNTRQEGDAIILNVTAPSHAKPHRIQARYAGALAFFLAACRYASDGPETRRLSDACPGEYAVGRQGIC